MKLSLKLFAAPIVFLQLFLFLDPSAFAADRYIVVFSHLDSNAEKRVGSAGGKVIHRLERYHAVATELSPDGVRILSKTSGVESIMKDPERHFLSQTVPYGITMVQADLVSDENVGNRKVCLIDSGYFKKHRDLQNNNVTVDTDDNLDQPLIDGCGHGSHVAGVISALNNSTGVVGVAGSGKLQLHIVKLFSNNCTTTFA
jgi:serine protease